MGEWEENESQTYHGKEKGLTSAFSILCLTFLTQWLRTSHLIVETTEWAGAEKSSESSTLPNQDREDWSNCWRSKGTATGEEKKWGVWGETQGRDDQKDREGSC